MSRGRRTSVSFDPALYVALQRKRAATGRSISSLVNDAVRDALAEDADDVAAIEARREQPTRTFESFLSDRRRRGPVRSPARSTTTHST